MRTVVVSPTYNEAENIEWFLRSVRAALPSADILIIDDNSPDGTGTIADRIAAELGNVKVIHRAGKDGLGSAYRFGFETAVDSGYELVVSMDVDRSHDPVVLPQMVAAIDAGADIAVGSRYVPGGGIRNWPLFRRVLSSLGNRYIGLMLGVGTRDCTSAYRAYRASALRVIRPSSTRAEGYAFLTELIRRASRARLRIAEVPITFVDRQFGASKMSGRIIAESMLLVTAWGLKDLPHRVRRLFGR